MKMIDKFHLKGQIENEFGRRLFVYEGMKRTIQVKETCNGNMKLYNYALFVEEKAILNVQEVGLKGQCSGR